MNEKNINFIKNEQLVRSNQVLFLLNYIISQEEIILAVFEEIKIVNSINPARGRVEESNLYILTDRKIINVLIKENVETINTYIIKLVDKTIIERETHTNAKTDFYQNDNLLISIKILLKNSEEIIFKEFNANEYFTSKILKQKAINFVTRLNQII